jgi:hypothetical protein
MPSEKTPGAAAKPASKRPAKPAAKPAKAAQPPKAPKANGAAAPVDAKPASSSDAKWPWADLPPTATLKLLKTECPRQPGSKAAEHWHSKYRNGMSIEQFRAGGGEPGRLRTDIRRGNIVVEPAK